MGFQYINIILSLIAFITLILSFVVFSQARKSQTNIFFLLFSLSLSLWIVTGIGLHYGNVSGNLNLVYLFDNLQSAFCGSLFFFFVLFSFNFPNEEAKIKPIYWLFTLPPFLFIVSLCILTIFSPSSPLAISKGYILNPNTYNPVLIPGFTYPVYGLFCAFYLMWVLLNLFRRYRYSGTIQRTQIKYVFYGCLSGGIIGIIFDYFVPVYLLKGSDTYWLGYFGPFFFIIFLTYAILKYRLFNIKLIATELLTFSIWGVLLIRIFLANTLGGGRFIEGGLFIFVLVFGIFLIRSVLQEIKQKEKLAELNLELDKANTELKNLNDHLEQKVAEQTVGIRRAYEVEKKARMELEELDKVKDQFILTTQHYLRTPLTIIKGYVQSLLGMPPEKTLGESKDYISKASEATERLGSLVNELLDVSEMQVKQGILDKKSTDVKKVIEAIISEIKPEIEQRKLKISIELPDDALANVDPLKFREALNNVIDNAVKYNNKGGSITIKVEKIVHPIEKDKRILRVSVEDTGIGIGAKEMPKLFARYFERGEEARKVYAIGRGIGLMAARNIINVHGGRIWAESGGRGKGAKFFIEIPA